MRLLSIASITFILSSTARAASINGLLEARAGSTTRSCYYCPTINAFNAGWFSSDKTSQTRFGYRAGSLDTRMACTYYEAGYKWTEKWWNGSKERYAGPRLIGRCYFSEDGDLLTSGSYAGTSSGECPSKAPRDMECAREFDKGSYYRLACKEPTSPKCTYESDQCYGCPRLNSDFVNINNEDGKLECGYSVKGKVANTCSYDPTNGTLVGKTSGSPNCPGSTTKASKCSQVKEANEQAAKKAAYLKEEFADKGLLAHPCEEYLREKYTRRYGIIIREYVFLACKVPSLLKQVKFIAGTEFAADLEKMKETKYGFYHVTTEAEKAVAEKKKKDEVRECLKKIHQESQEEGDREVIDDGEKSNENGGKKDGDEDGKPATAADYEPNEEELEAVAKYGNPCDPINRYW